MKNVFEAVGMFCKACVGSKEEVKSCTGDEAYIGECPLYEHRLRNPSKPGCPSSITRNAKARTDLHATVFHAVLKNCIQCQGGSTKVVDCDTSDCALHDLRLG